jgi:hypothetical protein
LPKGSLPAALHRSNNRFNCRLAFLSGCILGLQPDKLKVEDEEKIAFITPYNVFCYHVMPFGLNNA